MIRKLTKYKIFLISFCSVLTLAVIACLFILSNFLVHFQQNNPTTYARNFKDAIVKKDYEFILKNSGNSDGLTAGELGDYFEKEFVGEIKDITLNEVYSKSNNRYKLTAGEKSIEFEVINTGNKLKYNLNEYKYSLSFAYVDAVKVVAADGTVIFVDGKKFNPVEIGVIPNFAFEVLKDKKLIPQKKEYLIDKRLTKPVITDKNGNSPVETAKNRYELFSCPAEEEKAKYEKTGLDFVKIYAMFITNNAAFVNIEPMLYKNTDFYDGLKQFYNGWYNEHEGFGFSNIEFSNIDKLGENAFTIDIKFTHTVTRYGKKYVYECNYRVAFLDDKAVNLIVI